MAVMLGDLLHIQSMQTQDAEGFEPHDSKFYFRMFISCNTITLSIINMHNNRPMIRRPDEPTPRRAEPEAVMSSQHGCISPSLARAPVPYTQRRPAMRTTIIKPDLISSGEFDNSPSPALIIQRLDRLISSTI